MPRFDTSIWMKVWQWRSDVDPVATLGELVQLMDVCFTKCGFVLGERSVLSRSRFYIMETDIKYASY